MKSAIRQAMRNLASAPAPVPYAGRSNMSLSLMSALTGPASLEAYMRTYGVNGTVHGLVSLLATATAKPEWRLYRKTTDRRRRDSPPHSRPDQRTAGPQHQALKVRLPPHALMNQTPLTEALPQHID